MEQLSHNRIRQGSARIVLALAVSLCGCVPASETSSVSDATKVDRSEESRFRPIDEEQVSAPEPSASLPVTAVMQIRPAPSGAGDVVDVLVYARIASRHFLHAPDDAEKTFIPVSIELDLPDGVEALGEWQFPAGKMEHGSRVYRDSVVLRRTLKVDSRKKEQLEKLSARLRYQACTDELCWPPQKIELSANLLAPTIERYSK
jgi:hypothetical protein